MSWGIHKNPVAHIDTTPEMVLAAMETTIWDPETQTFVPWAGVARSKPEPEETPTGPQYFEWNSFQQDFVPWYPPTTDEGEEEE